MVARRITRVLGHRRYTMDGVDRYGNPVAGFAVAVDFPVYAVSPKQSVEEDAVGRRPIISGLTVYAPAGSAPVSSRDRFVFNGAEWDVEGEPGVWSDNPHGAGFHEGVQFDLVRSEG